LICRTKVFQWRQEEIRLPNKCDSTSFMELGCNSYFAVVPPSITSSKPVTKQVSKKNGEQSVYMRSPQTFIGRYV